VAIAPYREIRGLPLLWQNIRGGKLEASRFCGNRSGVRIKRLASTVAIAPKEEIRGCLAIVAIALETEIRG